MTFGIGHTVKVNMMWEFCLASLIVYMAQVLTVKFVGRSLIYGLSLIFYLKIPFSGLRIACEPWWNGC